MRRRCCGTGSIRAALRVDLIGVLALMEDWGKQGYFKAIQEKRRWMKENSELESTS